MDMKNSLLSQQEKHRQEQSNSVIQEIQSDLDSLLEFIQELSFSKDKNNSLRRRVSNLMQNEHQWRSSKGSTQVAIEHQLMSTSSHGMRVEETTSKGSDMNTQLHWTSLGNIPSHPSSKTRGTRETKEMHENGLSTQQQDTSRGQHQDPMLIAKGLVINTDQHRILTEELKKQLSLGTEQLFLKKNKRREGNNKKNLELHGQSFASSSIDHCNTRVCCIELVVSIIMDGNDKYFPLIYLSSYCREENQERTRAGDVATMVCFSDPEKDQVKRQENDSTRVSIHSSLQEYGETAFLSIKESLNEMGNRIKARLEREHDYQMYDWKTNSQMTQESQDDKEIVKKTTTVYEKVMMFSKTVKIKDEPDREKRRETLVNVMQF